MGIILALISAVSTSIFTIVMKLLGKRENNPWVMASAYQIISGLIMLTYSISEPLKANFNFVSIIFLILAWVAWSITSGLNYFAVRRLEVSTNILFAQIALVVSFLGSVIFFGDKVTWLRGVGALLVILATSLIFIQKNSFKNINREGLIYRFIASTAFAAALLLDKNNTSNFSIGIYTSMSYIIPGLIAFILSKVSVKEYYRDVKANFKYILGLSILSCVSYYCTMSSFKFIDASLTFTISNFATVITVIIGVIFFKERDNLLRKIIALAVIIIAAVLLNLSL